MRNESRRVALAAEAEQRPGITPRLFALTALLGVGGSLLWLAVAIVRVFADSWIAPIALSPDSDAVLALDLQLTRERAEMERVGAELERIDAEVAAIDGGLARLESLRNRSDDVFTYGADLSAAEEASLGRAIRNLREERAILERLISRQRDEVARAEAHLGSGLIQRRDLEQQQQSLDSLELQRIANARALEEAELRRRRADSSADQLRDSAEGGRDGAMPEIIARNEAETRLELEILRLQAERRGLVALRETGRRNLARLEEVMHDIEARPLYMATQRQMDVAFVPYEQLEGVRPGSTLVQCEAGIFFCREVGTVREVMPGEVVTQDPWGELARGRYAVLDLSDRAAVQERILRVR